MSGNTFGKILKITTFGESHGKAVGVIVDGVKPGLKISTEDIQKELDRRKPGQSKVTTPRKEKDKVEILSGIFEGKTTGTAIAMIVKNQDVDSSKYEKIKDLFRPGHADYTYFKKYGYRDYRGGGRASGRETVARVAAGALAKKLLKEKGIEITGYVNQIGKIKAQKNDIKQIEKNSVRCPDKDAASKMVTEIEKAKSEGDSLGGIVEIKAEDVPPGLGEPVFDKLDADIAKAIISVGAVKSVEIGAGKDAAVMKGSESNDGFVKEDNKIITKTNNAGGILGGISNGMTIKIKATVKPTPSISKEQETVDKKGKTRKFKTEGRHDPCICPRIVPVLEAMLALTLADHMLRHEAVKNG